MTCTVLFRKDFSEEAKAEFDIARKYLPCTDSRVGIKDSLVIGRYSVLPFYSELDGDLCVQGSSLINSPAQHRFIANFEWYDSLKDITPKTWFDLQSVPKDGGPYVVKGRTNSRKFEWNKKMFALNYLAAVDIASELMNDGLIGPQGVLVREYVPLKTLEVGLHGLPFSNEWRFFYYRDQLLSYGFYWTASEERGTMDEKGLALAQEAASRIAKEATFFVIDVAQKANGDWTVIEVNDGQMSGLSECDPGQLYSNLAKALQVQSE